MRTEPDLKRDRACWVPLRRLALKIPGIIVLLWSALSLVGSAAGAHEAFILIALAIVAIVLVVRHDRGRAAST